LLTIKLALPVVVPAPTYTSGEADAEPICEKEIKKQVIRTEVARSLGFIKICLLSLKLEAAGVKQLKICRNKLQIIPTNLIYPTFGCRIMTPPNHTHNKQPLNFVDQDDLSISVPGFRLELLHSKYLS